MSFNVVRGGHDPPTFQMVIGTLYTARHSFATVLKRSGANIAFISESLGHASITTTGNYLASFEKSERIKNAANLTNFESNEQDTKPD